MSRLILAALFLFHWCGQAISMAAEPPATSQPATAPVTSNSLARSLMAALGIQASKADPLAAIQAVIASSPSDQAAMDKAIDHLVDVILSGANPDALSSIQIANSSIWEIKQDERFGNFADRIELVKQLWSRAQSFQKSDTDRAKAYARSALLLGAYEDFIFGHTLLAMVYADPNKFKAIAQLSGEQTTAVDQVLTRALSSAPQIRTYRSRYHYVEGDLIESRAGALPEKELNEAIEMLDAAHRADGSLADQFYTVEDAWLLRNLAYARDDKGAKKQVEALLDRWKKAAKDPNVARWVNEAIDHVGPALTHSRVIGPGAKNQSK